MWGQMSAGGHMLETLPNSNCCIVHHGLHDFEGTCESKHETCVSRGCQGL